MTEKNVKSFNKTIKEWSPVRFKNKLTTSISTKF